MADLPPGLHLPVHDGYSPHTQPKNMLPTRSRVEATTAPITHNTSALQDDSTIYESLCRGILLHSLKKYHSRSQSRVLLTHLVETFGRKSQHFCDGRYSHLWKTWIKMTPRQKLNGFPSLPYGQVSTMTTEPRREPVIPVTARGSPDTLSPTRWPHIASSPIPVRPCWPHWPLTAFSKIDVLPESIRMFHALGGSHRHNKQCTCYSICPAVWLLSHIGCRQFITMDQGWQIEPKRFQTLAKLCVIQVPLTRTHHSAANGLVDRFHWTPKVVSMYHTRSKQPTHCT